jgi:hypothetical protein
MCTLQGPKIVFDDDNIHSSPCMAREKMGNLFLYMSSILQRNSCNDILKCIMGCSAIIPTQAA